MTNCLSSLASSSLILERAIFLIDITTLTDFDFGY